MLYPEGYISNERELKDACTLAKVYNTIMVGTSHADGSYRNCGISIPISYCIDSDGNPIYVSKADTSTRIIELRINEVFIKNNV